MIHVFWEVRDVILVYRRLKNLLGEFPETIKMRQSLSLNLLTVALIQW